VPERADRRQSWESEVQRANRLCCCYVTRPTGRAQRGRATERSEGVFTSFQDDEGSRAGVFDDFLRIYSFKNASAFLRITCKVSGNFI